MSKGNGEGRGPNFLYVAGPSRSGTTAFTKYLNEHPEVLVCRERFKWHPRERVAPNLFTFERILDFEDGYEKRDTERRCRVHEELLTRKDPGKLKWMGDKFPNYVRTLDTLAQNNPGASFIVMYRPVEEVAESYQARSENPEDAWLGGRDGFSMGIRHWNAAMRSTREFVESLVNLNVLLVSYHEFFGQNEACVPLISRFLGLDFDESVLASWKEASREFESKRRAKEPVGEKQRALIDQHADRGAEEWMLKRIEHQWMELGSYSPEAAGERIEERRRFAVRMAEERAQARAKTRRLERKAGALERELGKQRSRVQTSNKENLRLAKKVEDLRRQMQAVRSSRTWRLLDHIGRVKKKLGVG